MPWTREKNILHHNLSGDKIIQNCLNIHRNHVTANNSTTGWNDKIVVLKKTTLQLYFKTFIEKINSANLIM